MTSILLFSSVYVESTSPDFGSLLLKAANARVTTQTPDCAGCFLWWNIPPPACPPLRHLTVITSDMLWLT